MKSKGLYLMRNEYLKNRASLNTKTYSSWRKYTRDKNHVQPGFNKGIRILGSFIELQILTAGSTPLIGYPFKES